MFHCQLIQHKKYTPLGSRKFYRFTDVKNDVKAAECYALTADEPCDISNTVQQFCAFLTKRSVIL
jgi:hypothetical protein